MKLPNVPCLVIEHTKSEEEGYDWLATYSLRLPLGENDIRREDKRTRDGFLYLEMGSTKVTCSGTPDQYGQVSTPYRDGCHIKWDARILMLPAYAVYGEKVTTLKVWENGE